MTTKEEIFLAIYYRYYDKMAAKITEVLNESDTPEGQDVSPVYNVVKLCALVATDIYIEDLIEEVTE